MKTNVSAEISLKEKFNLNDIYEYVQLKLKQQGKNYLFYDAFEQFMEIVQSDVSEKNRVNVLNFKDMVETPFFVQKNVVLPKSQLTIYNQEQYYPTRNISAKTYLQLEESPFGLDENLSLLGGSKYPEQNEIYDINIATPNTLRQVKEDAISWQFRAEKKKESMNHYINNFNHFTPSFEQAISHINDSRALLESTLPEIECDSKNFEKNIEYLSVSTL